MDSYLFTEEWVNSIDIDALPDNIKPSALWCRAYYTTMSQIKNMDIMLKYQTDLSNKATLKISKLEEQIRKSTENNESLTRNLAYQHHNNEVVNKRIIDLEDRLKKSEQRAEKAELCSDTRARQEALLEDRIQHMESELTSANQSRSSLKAQLQCETERVNDTDSVNFQRELDNRRAEYRANEEYKLRVDAEYLLSSHGIYR